MAITTPGTAMPMVIVRGLNRYLRVGVIGSPDISPQAGGVTPAPSAEMDYWSNGKTAVCRTATTGSIPV